MKTRIIERYSANRREPLYEVRPVSRKKHEKDSYPEPLIPQFDTLKEARKYARLKSTSGTRFFDSYEIWEVEK